jgi:stage V sporulation protein G
MEITEVRIKLMEDSDDRLQAFCSITFDNAFVVRDLKIIDGANGPFVAMPSRKLTGHCQQCGSKNHLKAQYCNHCGARLREDRPPRDADGRAKLYADIAHPINSACREMIQNRVIAEFRAELDRAKQPGYVSKYDDEYDDDIDAATLLPPEESRPAAAPAPPTTVPPTTVPPTTAQPRTQVQPARHQPPAPHIPVTQPLSTPPPSGGTSGSSSTSSGSTGSGLAGGPHFGTTPAQRETADQEQPRPRDAGGSDSPRNSAVREGGSPGKPKSKGDFGAGIF